MELIGNAEHVDILGRICIREKDERAALASTDRETLQKLGIPLGSLPQKCKNLLKQAADYQQAMEVNSLDAVAFLLQHTDLALKEMNDEYEILRLRQKNEELDSRIDTNRKEIDELRKELESARTELLNQNPNPGTVMDEINIVRQKVASYEQSYEKTKSKYGSLRVGSELEPASLQALAARLAGLRGEEAALRDKAEHITLARTARRTLLQLKGAER